MKLRANYLRKYLSNLLSQRLSLTAGANAPTADEIYDQLVEPPNPKMGDLAFGCFRLAKAAKKAPPQLAQELQKQLSTDAIVTRIECAGPYVNFTFSAQAFGEHVLEPARSQKLFQLKLTVDEPKTMIEYSQPNTHKELHVGHMRNLCLGDALARLLLYAGVDLVKSTFPGDMGTHVAKCLWYMKNHNKETPPQTGKGEWLGRMYSRAHLKLEDEEGTDKEESNRQQLTEIIRQLEAKDGEYFSLWQETRRWSIELMQEVYDWAGVHFDRWYWESEVDADSVTLVKRLLAEGQLVVSDGAVGLDLNDQGLGFCLLLKSDGTGLYATKDLELARRKFEDYKVGRNLYVVDVRQALHFKQVFAVLKAIGYKQADQCVHLQYNFVELPDGAMSSRKGNIVPIMDLIEQMRNYVKSEYLSRYANDWSQKEIDTVADYVAQGAIKYGMLKIDNNKKIVFEMQEWLKLEGESGPFIQYSYARIASLQRKLGYDPVTQVDWSLLTEEAEHQLGRHMMKFNDLITQSALEYRPALVCAYVFDLAKLFNVFYHECPIGSALHAELKNARLALAAAVGSTIKKGLEVLGIPVPERM